MKDDLDTGKNWRQIFLRFQDHSGSSLPTLAYRSPKALFTSQLSSLSSYRMTGRTSMSCSEVPSGTVCALCCQNHSNGVEHMAAACHSPSLTNIQHHRLNYCIATVKRRVYFLDSSLTKENLYIVLSMHQIRWRCLDFVVVLQFNTNKKQLKYQSDDTRSSYNLEWSIYGKNISLHVT